MDSKTCVMGFGKRKVQKIGNSAFISLPKAWFDNTNVHIGDFVRATMDSDRNLIIHPDEGDDE